MFAAQGDYVDVAKLLLEQGANMQAALQDGDTALMLAARRGHRDMSKLLLDWCRCERNKPEWLDSTDPCSCV